MAPAPCCWDRPASAKPPSPSSTPLPPPSAATTRRSSPSTRARHARKARTRGLGIDSARRHERTDRSPSKQVDPAEALARASSPHIVRQAVERDGPRVVVIDSLNGYLHAMPEEQFLTAQLHELLSYLGRQGVTTLMVVAQHGVMGTNMVSPVDTSYLADSVGALPLLRDGRKGKESDFRHEETQRQAWRKHTRASFRCNRYPLAEPLDSISRGFFPASRKQVKGASSQFMKDATMAPTSDAVRAVTITRLRVLASAPTVSRRAR